MPPPLAYPSAVVKLPLHSLPSFRARREKRADIDFDFDFDFDSIHAYDATVTN